MKKIMLFAAALLVLAGCSKKENNSINGEEPTQGVLLTGIIDFTGGNPAKVGPNYASPKPGDLSNSEIKEINAYWKEGDEIIFIQNQKEFIFKLKDGAGKTQGVFEGPTDFSIADAATAYTPAEYYNKMVKEAGTADYEISYEEGTFQVLASGIKPANASSFTLNDVCPVYAIPLKSNSSTTLSKIVCRSGSDHNGKSVTLNFGGSGLEISSSAKTVYVNDGFTEKSVTFEFYKKDSEAKETKNITLEAEKNKIYEMPELELTFN